MHELMRIKDDICEELIRMTENGVNKGNLEPVYMAAVAAEKIMKMQVLEHEMDDGYSQRRRGYSREGGGYSGERERYDRYPRDGGSYDGGSYDDGESYARRGQHYVRGHYSRDEGMKEMAEVLERLERRTTDPKEKEALKHFIEKSRME